MWRRSQSFSTRAFGVACVQVHWASSMGKVSYCCKQWWKMADPVLWGMRVLRASLDREVQPGVKALHPKLNSLTLLC